MSYKDDLIYHRGMMEGQKSRVVAQIIKALEDILPQINGLAATATQTNINKTVEQIKKILDKEFAAISPELQQQILDLGIYESEFQQALLQSSLLTSSEVVITGVGQSVLKTAIFEKPIMGALFKDGLNRLNADVKWQVETAIRAGVVNGLTARQVQSQIRANYTMAERRMTSFIRTAIQNATNVATVETYLENDIKKVRINAILDSRTTDFCKGVNGDIVDLSKNPNLPPYHYNCRTFTTPILPEIDREEMNKNFAKWLEEDGNNDLTSGDKGQFVENSKMIMTLNSLKNKEEKRIGQEIG